MKGSHRLECSVSLGPPGDPHLAWSCVLLGSHDVESSRHWGAPISLHAIPCPPTDFQTHNPTQRPYASTLDSRGPHTVLQGPE